MNVAHVGSKGVIAAFNPEDERVWKVEGINRILVGGLLSTRTTQDEQDGEKT